MVIAEELIHKAIDNGQVIYVDWLTDEEVDIKNPDYSFEIYSSVGFGMGFGAIVKVIPKNKKTGELKMSERKEQEYKGYIIRPVYKTKWAVYKPGPPNWKVGGGRCGTVHPDERMSANLDSVEECKDVINRLVK